MGGVCKAVGSCWGVIRGVGGISGGEMDGVVGGCWMVGGGVGWGGGGGRRGFSFINVAGVLGNVCREGRGAGNGRRAEREGGKEG
jgi:hypothetical protein